MAKSDGIELTGPIEGRFAEILTPAALDLRGRAPAGAGDDAGRAPPTPGGAPGGVRRGCPAGLPARDPRDPRRGDWTVAPAPKDLQRRWVELTGPAERKMVINALNSGADVFMADFEDANTPSWRNMVQGQVNLLDAVERTIEHRNPDGRVYRLNDSSRPCSSARAGGISSSATSGRRRPRVGKPVRLRALRLPQRPAPARARERALLLPAEAREPSRGAALERRVRPGRGSARPPAGRDPRHRPRRDDPRRIRDGRDPVGAP